MFLILRISNGRSIEIVEIFNTYLPLISLVYLQYIADMAKQLVINLDNIDEILFSFFSRTYRHGECLLWRLQTISLQQRYGFFYHKYIGLWSAHRLSWALFNGQIPTGLY